MHVEECKPYVLITFLQLTACLVSIYRNTSLRETVKKQEIKPSKKILKNARKLFSEQHHSFILPIKLATPRFLIVMGMWTISWTHQGMKHVY